MLIRSLYLAAYAIRYGAMPAVRLIADAAKTSLQPPMDVRMMSSSWWEPTESCSFYWIVWSWTLNWYLRIDKKIWIPPVMLAATSMGFEDVMVIECRKCRLVNYVTLLKSTGDLTIRRSEIWSFVRSWIYLFIYFLPHTRGGIREKCLVHYSNRGAAN